MEEKKDRVRLFLLVIILLELIYISYGPVMTFIRKTRDAVTGTSVSRCEYEGRSYGIGEKRRATDGCNVCDCSVNGWACTEISCQVGSAVGASITGKLSYPSEFMPAQRVCALNIKDDAEYCQETLQGSSTYVINAPPGDYWVYAARAEGDIVRQRAYYSEYVVCGLSAECKDHTPITVTVTAGQVAEADPQDWYSLGQMDSIVIAPSRYEYNTHNYYPGSLFTLNARGLAKVEFYSTPYPPRDNASFSLIGEATMVSDDGDVQTWSLPIPAGFQATYVRAKGSTDNGDFLMSRSIWLVRPISTATVDSMVQ